MAIQHGMWKIGEKPQQLQAVSIESENLLEQQIFEDISILNPDWLLIGRQVRTAFDKIIDLLAIDANGSVIIIELKRNKTPREVVAQAIDYASWVVDLTPENIIDIYIKFATKYKLSEHSFDNAFRNNFGSDLKNIEINETHQMLIVAAELDTSTERIINYLNDHAAIPINAVFFNVFEDNGNKYLSRAWMIDPGETQERAILKGAREPWNGEFYVSFGHHQHRHWDDARKFGFISGGGKPWYSKTLNMLDEGDKVWVNIPGTGYVGVAEVIGGVSRLDNYQFPNETGPKTLLELDTSGDYNELQERDDDAAEYLVPVKWLYSEPIKGAFSEVGLFGNQNTVCKPTTPKWSHTVNRVRTEWKINL